MSGKRLRQGPVVGLAALVLGVLIAQVAVAGGSDEGKIASLQRQVNELRSQVDAPATASKKKKKKSKRGPAGPQGAQGPAGLSGYQQVSGLAVGPDTSSPKTAVADCPAGKVVTGGGYTRTGNASEMTLINLTSTRAISPTTWQVIAADTGAATAWSIQAFAICAAATP